MTKSPGNAPFNLQNYRIISSLWPSLRMRIILIPPSGPYSTKFGTPTSSFMMNANRASQMTTASACLQRSLACQGVRQSNLQACRTPCSQYLWTGQNIDVFSVGRAKPLSHGRWAVFVPTWVTDHSAVLGVIRVTSSMGKLSVGSLSSASEGFALPPSIH
jgi:hypothetical protein